MTSKKIFIVGPCLSMGGIERAISNVANELSVLGFQIVYFSIFKKVPFFSLHPGVIFEEPLDGSNVNSLSIIKTIRRIRKSVQQHQPDTVLVYNKFYAALTAIALLRLNVPFYISERSSPTYKWPIKIAIINKIAFKINRPTGVIAQTELAATFQRKYYATSEIKVVPNIVREVALYPAVPREPFILAVGRLNDPLKGFDRLLEAMAISKTSWPLFLAGGEAISDGTLHSLIEKQGLKERIHFLGKVTDMDALYARAGLFVIPSRSEGFPNALVEAMAAGVPCISFNFMAGPQDIIEDGVNGILVSDGDIQGLADAVDLLVLDPVKRARLGENSLAVRETYKADKIAKEIAQFILSK